MHTSSNSALLRSFNIVGAVQKIQPKNTATAAGIEHKCNEVTRKIIKQIKNKPPSQVKITLACQQANGILLGHTLKLKMPQHLSEGGAGRLV
jgi:hypothetical protein